MDIRCLKFARIFCIMFANYSIGGTPMALWTPSAVRIVLMMNSTAIDGEGRTLHKMR